MDESQKWSEELLSLLGQIPPSAENDTAKFEALRSYTDNLDKMALLPQGLKYRDQLVRKAREEFKTAIGNLIPKEEANDEEKPRGIDPTIGGIDWTTTPQPDPFSDLPAPADAAPIASAKPDAPKVAKEKKPRS